MVWSRTKTDNGIPTGLDGVTEDMRAAYLKLFTDSSDETGIEDDDEFDRVAASCLPPRRFRQPAGPRRNLGISDWANVTVDTDPSWFDNVRYTPQVCADTAIVAGICCDVQLSTGVGKNCSSLPCEEQVKPFAITHCVEESTLRNVTVDQIESHGYTVLSQYLLRDIAEVLYTGSRKGVMVGNPFVTQAAATTTTDLDLTPSTGPVSVNAGLGAIAERLAGCLGVNTGTILMPYRVFSAESNHFIVTDDLKKYRTRDGHGVMVDPTFDGRAPGTTGRAPGDPYYIYGIGRVDVLISKAFSPQALLAQSQAQPPLRRWRNGASDLPAAYFGHKQNMICASFIQQAAVAFSGCCRFAIAVDPCKKDC
jgi:hypothetical protein